MVVLQGLDPLRFDTGFHGGNTALAEIQVQHFLLHTGPFGYLGGSQHRIGLNPLLSLQGGSQHSLDDLRMLPGKGLAHHNAVEGGYTRLAAIEDFARRPTKFHDLRPRAEIGMGVDASGSDIGSTHRWCLIDDLHLAEQPGVTQGFERHPPGSAAHRNGQTLAGKVGQRLYRGVIGHHDAVTGALEVVAGHTDESGLLGFGFLKLGAIDNQRVVTHYAKVELAGKHLIGDGGAGVVVTKYDLVPGIFILPGGGQIFFNEFELVQNHATGNGIGHHALMTDADFNGLRHCYSAEQKRTA